MDDNEELVLTLTLTKEQFVVALTDIDGNIIDLEDADRLEDAIQLCARAITNLDTTLQKMIRKGK